MNKDPDKWFVIHEQKEDGGETPYTIKVSVSVNVSVSVSVAVPVRVRLHIGVTPPKSLCGGAPYHGNIETWWTRCDLRSVMIRN